MTDTLVIQEVPLDPPPPPPPPPWLPYVVYSLASMDILRTGVCPQERFATEVSQGEGILIGQVESFGTHFVRDGTLVPYTPEQRLARAKMPAFQAVWSNTTFSWIDQRSLVQQKADAAEQIKHARDAAIYGGFTWDGSRFDSDETSQARLLGAMVCGAGETWRLADNTWRHLSPADMTAIYAALADHVRAQFITFALLEAQLASANTATELETIAWPATS